MACIKNDAFHIVLPSNSSIQYFPSNTTTRFITQLSHPLALSGEWAVALEEINIPMTFLHVPKKSTIYFAKKPASLTEEMKIIDVNGDELDTVNSDYSDLDYSTVTHEIVDHGIFQNIGQFIEVLNNTYIFKSHLHFHIRACGIVHMQLICGDQCPLAGAHNLLLPPVIQQILGFPKSKLSMLIEDRKAYGGIHPASLRGGIPSSMFVYSDICENYITGDVQTPLLRVVPLHVDHHYQYGSTAIKCFSPPRYIPLLRRNFQTIEIDIRDEFGQPLLFEGGTLTVTLHFKRIA